jgi:hypothetical protein
MPLLVGRVDGKPLLVDGRNRREACRRAGIVPHYTLLEDGEDLPARIISENVYRRHMTKGQRAMVVAMIHPEGEKGGRGNKTRSYATVEDRKNKGIESYIGGKDLCLSHFGYTS